MEEKEVQHSQEGQGGNDHLRTMIRSVIEEFVIADRQKSEPAHKMELVEERRRREQLEQRVNELIEENRRNKALAEEAERHSQIRQELQRLGVGKVDLAFKVVKDDIGRAQDGGLVAKTEAGEVSLKDYLASFVNANPEFLPARIPGGSGLSGLTSGGAVIGPTDLDRIKPGMSADELQRMREQVSHLARQTLRGE